MGESEPKDPHSLPFPGNAHATNMRGIMKPTEEQNRALALFKTGKSLAIEAGAGTGKTTTLKLLAESAPDRRGQYVAFNKAIVDESGAKMPRNVRSNTAHSLAFRAIGFKYKDRLNSPRMKSWDIAAFLGLDPLIIELTDGEKKWPKRLSETYLAGVTMRAVGKFCQSADLEPTEKHVPYIDGIDLDGSDFNNKLVAEHLKEYVRLAWSGIQDKGGSLTFGHDHYLKMWHLSDPKIMVDYILFDEAQDANPVLRAIIEMQKHAQIIWVGDSQQAIYGFTGAINALALVEVENRTFLTQSFRFGQEIADIANMILSEIPKAEIRLTGNPAITSDVGKIEHPNVILTRTNAAAVREVLEGMRRGLRVHLVGGGGEIVSFARAAEKLQNGGRTEHPELACFDDWNEVLDYVDHDEQGEDLRLLVSLIQEFGAERIISAMARQTGETNCDLIVSTAHKSKGREWNAVKLASDFPDTPRGDELKLLYVAATRAKHRLDITGVSHFMYDGWDDDVLVTF